MLAIRILFTVVLGILVYIIILLTLTKTMTEINSYFIIIRIFMYDLNKF